MPTSIGPWDVGFPVRFRANGDTVHDAFYKHIQEIERIYGLLNALDTSKLDSSDLAAHINSSNPHPNLDINNTKGNLNGARLTGRIDASLIYGDLIHATISIDRVTGNIPADRIYGLLVNAQINYQNVQGLEEFIRNLVQELIEEYMSTHTSDPYPVGTNGETAAFPFTLPPGGTWHGIQFLICKLC